MRERRRAQTLVEVLQTEQETRAGGPVKVSRGDGVKSSEEHGRRGEHPDGRELFRYADVS